MFVFVLGRTGGNDSVGGGFCGYARVANDVSTLFCVLLMFVIGARLSTPE